MKIRTLGQVSDRTAGGHVYSAGEGTESVIDDGNTDMVDLIRLMVARGQVEIIEDVVKAKAAVLDVDSSDPDVKRGPGRPRKTDTK